MITGYNIREGSRMIAERIALLGSGESGESGETTRASAHTRDRSLPTAEQGGPQSAHSPSCGPLPTRPASSRQAA